MSDFEAREKIQKTHKPGGLVHGWPCSTVAGSYDIQPS